MAAADPRLDALRAKMEVVENAGFTRDYLDPSKRSIGNAVQVFFRDGTATGRVSGGISHRPPPPPLPRACRCSWRSSSTALRGKLPARQADAIVALCGDPAGLDATPVQRFMDLVRRLMHGWREALLHRVQFMKNIRLSGREATVIRSLGFGLGMMGPELLEHARLTEDDLVDVLNGLMEVGYVECTPFANQTTATALPTTEYEVNSAYAHELKNALGFREAVGNLGRGNLTRRREGREDSRRKTERRLEEILSVPFSPPSRVFPSFAPSR